MLPLPRTPLTRGLIRSRPCHLFDRYAIIKIPKEFMPTLTFLRTNNWELVQDVLCRGERANNVYAAVLGLENWF